MLKNRQKKKEITNPFGHTVKHALRAGTLRQASRDKVRI